MIELPFEDHTLDGVSFRVFKLPYKESRRVMLLLGKKVFPSIKQALETMSAKDEDGKAQASAMVGGLASVFESMGEADLETLDAVYGSYCEVIHDDSRVQRMKADVIAHTFSGGRMALYIKWLVLCTKVNFSDFLGVLGSAGQGRI